MIKPLLFSKHSPTAAKPEDLVRLEAQLGLRFPQAFFEFCSRWNGGWTSKENEMYPVPDSFLEFHEEYPGGKGVLARELFGITDEFWQCSFIKEYERGCKEFGLMPISADIFGNRTVLRTDSPTKLVYWWDHELWEMPDEKSAGPKIAKRPRLIPIAENLESFYNGLTTDPERDY